MPTLDDTTRSSTTRRSLHAVAEHVLSAALHAETGRIGLRQTAGGFGTPVFDHGGRPRQIVIDGTNIELRDGEQVRRAPITTLRAAGELAEVEPGAPVDVYTPTTPLDLDAVLGTDDRHAQVVADWFALVDAALVRLRGSVDGDEPPLNQLWPEHFDLATTIGEVNYGGSPGDQGHDQPYLYVGPRRRPAADEFWNEPFGARLSFAAVSVVDDAVAFFLQGQERLRSA
jgi:hypothetical protein